MMSITKTRNRCLSQTNASSNCKEIMIIILLQRNFEITTTMFKNNFLKIKQSTFKQGRSCYSDPVVYRLRRQDDSEANLLIPAFCIGLKVK